MIMVAGSGQRLEELQHQVSGEDLSHAKVDLREAARAPLGPNPKLENELVIDSATHACATPSNVQ